MRTVVTPLKREELVYRLNRRRIGRSNPHFPAPWQLTRLVGDLILSLGHHSRAGHLARMHESGNGEIASRESSGDVPHVRANRLHSCAVGCVSLQLDATSIG
jgi:hypothetical protein